MQELAFSIPVSGTILIDENTITITVNRAETRITFEPAPSKEERLHLRKGQTLFDILLETAQSLVGSDTQRRFTTAELYHEALGKYPQLRRNSWAAHVIASSPSHRSHRHHSSKRDYFNYLGNGIYELNRKYLSTEDAGRTIKADRVNISKAQPPRG